MEHERASLKRLWRQMIYRCHDTRSDKWHRYGGRGIRVCDEWRASFAAFAEHVGPRPSPRHTVDRIDNARGYEPGNVRWATKREQQQNRRNSKMLTHRGKTLCVAEWARRLRIEENTIRWRLKNGWAVEDALRR